MKPKKKDLHLFLPCLFLEPFFYMRVMSQQDQPVRLCNAQILQPDLFLLLPVTTGLHSCALLWALSFSCFSCSALLWALSFSRFSCPAATFHSVSFSKPNLVWFGKVTPKNCAGFSKPIPVWFGKKKTDFARRRFQTKFKLVWKILMIIVNVMKIPNQMANLCLFFSIF